MIEFAGLTVNYGERAALRGVDGCFADGTLTAVIGPNGSGKSTLFRALAGLIGWHGSVTIAGCDAGHLSAGGRARLLALSLQGAVPPQAMTAWELIALARLPFRRPWQRMSALDRDAVAAAALDAGAAELLWRPLAQLSGGEMGRVVFAAALAQSTPNLLLDEPTAAMDPKGALALFHCLKQRCAAGLCAAAAVHDLSLAAYADRFVALREGRVLAAGPMTDLDEDLLMALYDVPFCAYDSQGGKTLWFPCKNF